MGEPEAFAAQMRALVATLTGPELHRAVDQLMCDTMRAAGYADGVEVFMHAVEGYHDDSAPR